MIALLTEQLVQPVDFIGEVRAMYEAGARVFVEVGPRAVLTGLVSRILGDERPHVCVPLDGGPNRSGVISFLNGVAALAADGAAIRVERLFVGRVDRRLDLRQMNHQSPPGRSRLRSSTKRRPM